MSAAVARLRQRHFVVGRISIGPVYICWANSLAHDLWHAGGLDSVVVDCCATTNVRQSAPVEMLLSIGLLLLESAQSTAFLNGSGTLSAHSKFCAFQVLMVPVECDFLLVHYSRAV
jgi:hypothetical protein